MSGDMWGRLAESHGYAVLCVGDGLSFVIGGFSAFDSASDFAKDPTATRYPCGLTADERADLFVRFEREVIADLSGAAR